MLTLHPMAVDVSVMIALSAAFIAPAVWEFGRRD
jgi:hypothetical protein